MLSPDFLRQENVYQPRTPYPGSYYPPNSNFPQNQMYSYPYGAQQQQHSNFQNFNPQYQQQQQYQNQFQNQQNQYQNQNDPFSDLLQ